MPVTKHQIEMAVTHLRDAAIGAGLMDEKERLIYEAGVTSGGVTAKLWVGRRGTHAHFVPMFTLDNTKREQLLIMQTAARALRCAYIHALNVKDGNA